MTTSARCTACGGFLHHSYIASDGVDVYKCNHEDNWNDKGRYFIFTGTGTVEVEPLSSRQGKGKSWSYQLVDKERLRLKLEAESLNRELDKRQKMYKDSLVKMDEQTRYKDKYEEPDSDA